MDISQLTTWLETVIGIAAALAPIVAFLVAVIKTTAADNLPARYYPLVSVAAGVGIASAVAAMTPFVSMREAALTGALAGGIASGMFAIGKGAEVNSILTALQVGQVKIPTALQIGQVKIPTALQIGQVKIQTPSVPASNATTSPPTTMTT